jgi:hypothetical protein
MRDSGGHYLYFENRRFEPTPRLLVSSFRRHRVEGLSHQESPPRLLRCSSESEMRSELQPVLYDSALGCCDQSHRAARCRPMGAWAGKRQRPCADLDNARSLDQSCVNHELIKSKPLGTRGARVLSRTFAKTRQAPEQLPPRTTRHLLVRIESRANRK